MNHLAVFLTILVFLTTSIDSKHKGGHRNEPEFLKNLTSSAKKSFFEISKNPGFSIQQIEDKLQQWAKENNVEDQYTSFASNNTERKEELNKNVTKVITRLAEAKEKVDKILADKSKTRIQQQDAIKEVSKEYPQEVPTLFFIGKQFGAHEHDHKKDKDSRGDSSSSSSGRRANRHRD